MKSEFCVSATGGILAWAALSAGVAEARFVDVEIETCPAQQVRQATVPGKAESLLPPEKKWRLVWHDEFDGAEVDRTKWMCRESFWGQDFPAFAHGFEGVEMTGETMKLHLLRKGDDFCSPHLQTGSLTYDVPKDASGFWPFGAYRKPLFMKRYGYFEIRCRLPKSAGWHAAFWLQAPGVGSSPNPAVAGVETDIFETYRHLGSSDGRIVGGNSWNGYGRDSVWFGHFAWKHEETADGWHVYGCDWSPEGYTFYCDGKKVGEQNYPVSHVEQFLLVSTEPGGYRKTGGDGGLSEGRRTWGKPDPRLFAATLPDCFEVDFVRVYDAVPTPDPPLASPSDAALRTWVDAAWKRVMTTFYSSKTGGIYICEPEKVQPAKDFPGGLLKDEFHYGVGLEDCAINGGVALSGLVDAYAVTKDPAYAADAEKVAQGLLNLVEAHPYKGFVARGLCVEDGRSICRISSRDQVTHWAHDLWRYWRSGMVPERMKAAIRRDFAAVAERMERNVTEANRWNFLTADGVPDPRGICKMRHTMPHEAARLAMVYAAAGDVTGDAHWTDLYRELREEALDGSCRLATLSAKKISDWMPSYTLLQMNSSLEVLLELETSPRHRAQIISAMVTCARLARARAKWVRGGDSTYLCACAEVHLAQQMVPADAFEWSPFQRAILANAIVKVPADKVGACRAAHLFAAYWRMRRLGRHP